MIWPSRQFYRSYDVESCFSCGNKPDRPMTASGGKLPSAGCKYLLFSLSFVGPSCGWLPRCSPREHSAVPQRLDGFASSNENGVSTDPFPTNQRQTRHNIRSTLPDQKKQINTQNPQTLNPLCKKREGSCNSVTRTKFLGWAGDYYWVLARAP